MNNTSSFISGWVCVDHWAVDRTWAENNVYLYLHTIIHVSLNLGLSPDLLTVCKHLQFSLLVMPGLVWLDLSKLKGIEDSEWMELNAVIHTRKGNICLSWYALEMPRSLDFCFVLLQPINICITYAMWLFFNSVTVRVSSWGSGENFIMAWWDAEPFAAIERLWSLWKISNI